MGLAAARAFPPRLLEAFGQFFATAYGLGHRRRRETVIRNLLPPLNFDRREAEKYARALFRNFGLKLADLWRHESGQSMDDLLPQGGTWPDFRVSGTGRGILLVTPHLGNWEFGSLLLQRRGIQPLVITQTEPHTGFTELRARSRLQQGVQTLIIGENPFAFVEVIRRLESGGVVALLVDRPPPPTAVTVKIFGHKFAASRAPAELARASGCGIVPVILPRVGDRYAAKVLPEVLYDRAALGSHEARANLTQEIMRQFEPLIRDYIDQWYHFVPVWQSDAWN